MRQIHMDMSYDDGIVERDVARQKLRTDQRRIQYARGKAGLLETQRWTRHLRIDNEEDRANRVAAYERYIERVKGTAGRGNSPGSREALAKRHACVSVE